ncbi:MAG: TIGR03013 family PEP-CTERM/XrtA system glycosyltransferase [Deltaproteobacteria bacterium]|jgi:sugar transferase (PEP-CTERM system associated)|nr:TIGR03013 family PEP-CTERM/XrtA system glycosyltransferase [Deltaproteobacteria bacterium]
MPKILHKYYSVRKIFFVLGEGALICFSLLMAAMVRLNWHSSAYEVEGIVWLRILVATVVCQVSLYYHELYEIRVTESFFELSVRIVQALGAACIMLAGIYYCFPVLILGRGIFLTGILLLILLIVSWRFLYRHILKNHLFSEKILLVGGGNLAHLIFREIEDNLDSGYSVAAIVHNAGDSKPAEYPGIESYDDYDHLCEIAREKGTDKIIVALDEKRGRFPTRTLLDCKMRGLSILDGVGFYENLSGKILVERTNPSWFIFSEGFRRHKLTLWGKRCIDILLSSLGLVLGAPVMLVAAFVVKVTSPGPVFFKQTRVGQWEKPITVVKFRTMIRDAESQSGAVWAEEDDPRITKAGKALRQLRLDELPQLWNILRGQMSFVGPRPERPEFVKQLSTKIPYYVQRHSVKPGLTGWAQVSYPYGASEEDALKKLEYDLFYIKNLSLVMDILIVFQTIKTVILGKGAR